MSLRSIRGWFCFDSVRRGSYTRKSANASNE